jgi:DNA-binding transcriptional regulator YiaG
MAKNSGKAAYDALAATDWSKIDATTDKHIAELIAPKPDTATDMAPEIDVHATRRAACMTQAEFVAAYEFRIRTVPEWERGAKRPSGLRGPCGAIEADPEGLGKAPTGASAALRRWVLPEAVGTYAPSAVSPVLKLASRSANPLCPPLTRNVSSALTWKRRCGERKHLSGNAVPTETVQFLY